MKQSLLESLTTSRIRRMNWLLETEDYYPQYDSYSPSPPKKRLSRKARVAIGAGIVGAGLLGAGAVGGMLRQYNWRSKFTPSVYKALTANTPGNIEKFQKAAKTVDASKLMATGQKYARKVIGYPRALARGAVQGVKSPIANIRYLGRQAYKATLGRWDDD